MLSRVTITFSGFRSRCTIPVACALASPSAICPAIPSSFFSGRGSADRSLRRLSPSTSSIAIHETPSVAPMSKTVTMLGWLSAEAERASFSKRLSRSSFAARSAGRTLIATSRPSRVSRAR